MAYDGVQRPSEIAAVFNAVLSAFEDGRRCFQITRVLGSMLAIDFGRQVVLPSRNGQPITLGSGVLSVGNAYWWIGGTHRRLNSELLDDTLFPILKERLVGRDLLSIEGSAKALRVLFSGDVSLNIDLTNAWAQEPGDEVCVLSANGISATLLPERRVQLRSDTAYRHAA
jgi:hypothetical protein